METDLKNGLWSLWSEMKFTFHKILGNVNKFTILFLWWTKLKLSGESCKYRIIEFPCSPYFICMCFSIPSKLMSYSESNINLYYRHIYFFIVTSSWKSTSTGWFLFIAYVGKSYGWALVIGGGFFSVVIVGSIVYSIMIHHS